VGNELDAVLATLKITNPIIVESNELTNNLYGIAIVIMHLLESALVISGITILILSANINKDLKQFNTVLDASNIVVNNFDNKQNITAGTAALNKVTNYGFLAITTLPYIGFIISQNLPIKPRYGQLVSNYKNYVLYTLIIQIIVLLIILFGYALDKKRINKK
jgi:hypothetical protein